MGPWFAHKAFQKCSGWDGFCDAGRGASWPGTSHGHNREVLVVNRNDDQALRSLVASVSHRLQHHGDIEDTVARVKIVALANAFVGQVRARQV